VDTSATSSTANAESRFTSLSSATSSPFCLIFSRLASYKLAVSVSAAKHNEQIDATGPVMYFTKGRINRESAHNLSRWALHVPNVGENAHMSTDAAVSWLNSYTNTQHNICTKTFGRDR
jgi:hypothetical protein